MLTTGNSKNKGPESEKSQRNLKESSWAGGETMRGTRRLRCMKRRDRGREHGMMRKDRIQEAESELLGLRGWGGNTHNLRHFPWESLTSSKLCKVPLRNVTDTLVFPSGR